MNDDSTGSYLATLVIIVVCFSLTMYAFKNQSEAIEEIIS